MSERNGRVMGELALLLERFDGLIETPADVEKLEQAILQWAVMGRLVEQSPEDEPASTLLEQISVEKTLFASSNGLRREKALPSVNVDEERFELPSNWIWTRVGHVATIRGGKRVPKGFRLLDEPTRYIYIRVTDMKNGSIESNGLKYISKEVHEQIKKYIIERDDLYITIAGTIGAIGNVPERFHGMNLTENAARITPHCLDKDFLKLMLSSPFCQSQFTKKVNKMAQPKLALIRIKTTVFPLPPLEEQRRIVAKVDALFAQTRALKARLETAGMVRDRLQRAAVDRFVQEPSPSPSQREGDGAPRPVGEAGWGLLATHFDMLHTTPAHIDALKQTILQLAVMGRLVPQNPNDEPASMLLERIAAEKARLVKEGKIRKGKKLEPISAEDMPYDIPNDWQWVYLEQISYVGTGSTPLRSNPSFWNGSVPWITSSATGNLHVHDADEFVTGKALDETSLQLYPKHTLLVAMYGQGKTRGQVTELMLEATCNQACAAIVTEGFSEECRDYIKLFFQKSYNDLRSLAAGGAQPNLNLGKVKKAQLPLPPLEEQKRIVVKVDELLALCDRVAVGLVSAETARTQLLDAVLAQAV